MKNADVSALGQKVRHKYIISKFISRNFIAKYLSNLFSYVSTEIYLLLRHRFIFDWYETILQTLNTFIPEI